jgi:hypothetical protein
MARGQDLLKILPLPRWLRIPVVCVATLVVASACNGSAVTLRSMIGDAQYWPPPCNSSPCVLTGMGGVVHVWEQHVDENLKLGRKFVVWGVCASACEIAARRANATVLPGSRLIKHTPSPTVMS